MKKVICHECYNYWDAVREAKEFMRKHYCIRYSLRSIPFVETCIRYSLRSIPFAETEDTVEYFVPASQYSYWRKGKTYYLHGKKYHSEYEVEDES